ncbi:hypothetical protein ACLI4Q_20280 [Natrialbaceae archaeon A-CW1-1]
MSLTVQEFLQRKGAVGLLSLLHERPMTYSEIEPEIEVTSSTIIERRDDAAELGLLTISLGEADVGTKKVYHLTDMGEFLTDKMAREGIISNYRKMRTLQQLLDEQTTDIVTWVGENPSQLMQFEEAIEGTIIREGARSADPSGKASDSPGAGDGSWEKDNNDSSAVPSQHQSNQRTDNTDDAPTGTNGENEKGGDEQPSGRPESPSNSISIDVMEPDTENLSQGTLSEMGQDEVESKGENEEE